jgi:hypothetical protein
MAYELFLRDVLTQGAVSLPSAFLGPNQLSTSYFDMAKSIVGRELQMTWDVMETLSIPVQRPVIVGHGATGLFAKALSLSSIAGSLTGTPFEDAWQISFEAPTLADTPVSALANQTNSEANHSRIFNYYGKGSFYALFDETALFNDRIPDYGLSRLVPPNPFQTFCFAVAACWNDNRFDALCNDVFSNFTTPRLNFSEIWDTLGRKRFR